jgi:HEAT repeat protein
MSDLENSVASLVAELGTPGEEHAFHNLIELGPGVISILMSTFRDEERPGIRTRLIEAISQFRDPATVTFLEAALNDSEASVWKASLDGLVSLGGPEVISALRRVRQRELVREDNRTSRLEWINEALQQTGNRLG